ncbi:MAG: hypothetical protein NTV01_02515 [Bacteroidia bacterium]|nr:hypothetical protein [Bacteroidia bacterium]
MTDLEKWGILHRLGQELFSLEPWKYLYETDIFGIRSPLTGKDYFISIMGSNHEVYALSAYEGSEALGRFWNLENSAGVLGADAILTIPHFIISLDDRDIVPDDQVKIIRELGITYRGKKAWLTFSRIDAGFFPATPAGEQLNELQVILEQSFDVLKRVKDDPSFIHSDGDPEDDYLFREAAAAGEIPEWKDVHRGITMEKVRISYEFDPALIPLMQSMMNHRIPLQADLVLLPRPVHEKGSRPYFPATLFLVDGKSGMILGAEIIPPKPDYHSILSRIPQTLLKMLTRAKACPVTIKYRHPDLESALEFIAGKTNIKLEYSPKLPALDKALRSFKDSLG